MKIADILTLLETVSKLQDSPVARTTKIGFMLAANKRVLEQAKENFQHQVLEIAPPDERLTAYEAERVAALTAVAERDADGNPKIVNGNFVVANPEQVLPEITEMLLARYPEADRMMQERLDGVQALAEQDFPIALRKVDLADWPDQLPDIVEPAAVSQLMLLTNY